MPKEISRWRGEGPLAGLRMQVKPCGDWPAPAPCQRLFGAATISDIYFGIFSGRGVTRRQNPER
jgi:hypothetical protein